MNVHHWLDSDSVAVGTGQNETSSPGGAVYEARVEDGRLHYEGKWCVGRTLHAVLSKRKFHSSIAFTLLSSVHLVCFCSTALPRTST